MLSDKAKKHFRTVDRRNSTFANSRTIKTVRDFNGTEYTIRPEKRYSFPANLGNARNPLVFGKIPVQYQVRERIENMIMLGAPKVNVLKVLGLWLKTPLPDVPLSKLTKVLHLLNVSPRAIDKLQ